MKTIRHTPSTVSTWVKTSSLNLVLKELGSAEIQGAIGLQPSSLRLVDPSGVDNQTFRVSHQLVVANSANEAFHLTADVETKVDQTTDHIVLGWDTLPFGYYSITINTKKYVFITGSKEAILNSIDVWQPEPALNITPQIVADIKTQAKNKINADFAKTYPAATFDSKLFYMYDKGVWAPNDPSMPTRDQAVVAEPLLEPLFVALQFLADHGISWSQDQVIRHLFTIPSKEAIVLAGSIPEQPNVTKDDIMLGSHVESVSTTVADQDLHLKITDTAQSSYVLVESAVNAAGTDMDLSLSLPVHTEAVKTVAIAVSAFQIDSPYEAHFSGPAGGSSAKARMTLSVTIDGTTKTTAASFAYDESHYGGGGSSSSEITFATPLTTLFPNVSFIGSAVKTSGLSATFSPSISTATFNQAGMQTAINSVLADATKFTAKVVTTTSQTVNFGVTIDDADYQNVTVSKTTDVLLSGDYNPVVPLSDIAITAVVSASDTLPTNITGAMSTPGLDLEQLKALFQALQTYLHTIKGSFMAEWAELIKQVHLPALPKVDFDKLVDDILAQLSNINGLSPMTLPAFKLPIINTEFQMKPIHLIPLLFAFQERNWSIILPNIADAFITSFDELGRLSIQDVVVKILMALGLTQDNAEIIAPWQIDVVNVWWDTLDFELAPMMKLTHILADFMVIAHIIEPFDHLTGEDITFDNVKAIAESFASIDPSSFVKAIVDEHEKMPASMQAHTKLTVQNVKASIDEHTETIRSAAAHPIKVVRSLKAKLEKHLRSINAIDHVLDKMSSAVHNSLSRLGTQVEGFARTGLASVGMGIINGLKGALDVFSVDAWAAAASSDNLVCIHGLAHNVFPEEQGKFTLTPAEQIAWVNLPASANFSVEFLYASAHYAFNVSTTADKTATLKVFAEPINVDGFYDGDSKFEPMYAKGNVMLLAASLDAVYKAKLSEHASALHNARQHKHWWSFLVSALEVVGGVALAAFTGGASLVIAIGAAVIGVTAAVVGLKDILVGIAHFGENVDDLFAAIGQEAIDVIKTATMNGGFGHIDFLNSKQHRHIHSNFYIKDEVTADQAVYQRPDGVDIAKRVGAKLAIAAGVAAIAFGMGGTVARVLFVPFSKGATFMWKRYRYNGTIADTASATEKAISQLGIGTKEDVITQMVDAAQQDIKTVTSAVASLPADESKAAGSIWTKLGL